VHDLVERRCQVVTTDSVVIFSPSPVYETSFSSDQFHPRICGKPAVESVEYPDGKVYMCMEHWLAATSGSGNTELASTTEVHWKVPTDAQEPE